MTIAYLVNQYPHVSHTFIRREIAALESLGLTIQRFSVRPPPANLIDPSDLAEVNRTHLILAKGLLALIASTIVTMVKHPVLWWKALTATVRLGRRSDRGVIRHLVYLAEACHLTRELSSMGVKHLHAHFGTNPATVALLSRLLGGPPYSFTVHGPEEFDKPESLSLGEKIAAAKFAVAISSYGRSQLCRWSRPEDWDKLRVVHCGLQDDFLSAAQTPVPDVQRFVCVGRLSEQKGQLILLEAASLLRDRFPRLEIVLAGDGPMRGMIEKRIAELKLRTVVRITGWLSNAEVREQIESSRAMVLPSFAEGLPVVLMEALALGRPVITSYIAGIPELVQPGINGWLVPAGSSDDLANAMAIVLAMTTQQLTEMGKNGASAARLRHNAMTEAAKLAKEFGQS